MSLVRTTSYISVLAHSRNKPRRNELMPLLSIESESVESGKIVPFCVEVKGHNGMWPAF